MPPSYITTIIKQIDTLPSLPVTVSRVMSVTADPESSAQDLMKAILPDQSMCATILKLANSAFFGVPKEVSTLEKAVTVLGFNEIQNIVLGKAVFNSFHNLNSTNREIVNAFWDHCFTCGLAAKIIAEQNNYSASELFIAGLIHDIGKLVMFLTLPDSYLPTSPPWDYQHNKSQALENQEYGINHNEAGLILLKRWLFPDRLTTTTGFHHRPEEAPSDIAHALIIQTADALSLVLTSEEGKRETLLDTLHHNLGSSCKELYKKQFPDWQPALFKKWFAALVLSLEKDSAVLNIFTD